MLYWQIYNIKVSRCLYLLYLKIVLWSRIDYLERVNLLDAGELLLNSFCGVV